MSKFRSLKSEIWVHTLANRTSCDMYIPYAGRLGMVLLRYGKLTIGKLKSSRLSYIFMEMVGLSFIKRSKNGASVSTVLDF
jgi:hypothetical protein